MVLSLPPQIACIARFRQPESGPPVQANGSKFQNCVDDRRALPCGNGTTDGVQIDLEMPRLSSEAEVPHPNRVRSWKLTLRRSPSERIDGREEVCLVRGDGNFHGVDDRSSLAGFPEVVLDLAEGRALSRVVWADNYDRRVR